MNSAYRPLTVAERELLEKLLDADFSGREELRDQLSSITASEIDSNGSLAFQCGSTSRATVKNRIPTEGECRDSDGVTIHVLLHVLNGIISELEIFKEDSSDVQVPPTARTLVLLPPA